MQRLALLTLAACGALDPAADDAAGGWFTDLAVEVRQDGEWIEVDALAISPEYPFGPSAGARTTYELRFAETWGDGVRIVGTPGGSARFTSIAELAASAE